MVRLYETICGNHHGAAFYHLTADRRYTPRTPHGSIHPLNTQKITEGTSDWQVAQLYSDKQLMGSGDVALDDRYGFAESWNCYSLKDDCFDKCLGIVKSEILNQTILASTISHNPEPEGSLISFFREMEVEVGTYLTVQLAVKSARELEKLPITESIKNYCKRHFSYDAIKDALKDWNLPQVTDDVFQFLTSAIAPPELSPLTASSKLKYKQVNHVRKNADEISVEPVLIEINFSEWQGDGYLVSGKLTKSLNVTTQLMGCLINESGVCKDAGLVTLTSNDVNFDLFFSGATKEGSNLDNLHILILSHVRS